MEYLMTYGWAILIIAIVAALLFALGLFGQSSSSSPTGCSAQSNFICSNPVYTANGISVTIGQNSGQDYYGAWAFVVSSSEPNGNSGLPQNFSESNVNNMVPLGLMTPGQTVSFDYGGRAYTAAGEIPNGNVPIGSQFNGYVWLGYCTVINCNSPTNFAKVGAISVKASGGTFAGGTTTTVSGQSTSSTSTSTTSTISASSTTTIHYVSILLSNQQSSGTSSNFQQMLTLDSANYNGANEINSGWTNVEFTAVAPANAPANGNVPLYAWCESGCTGASTSTVVWVNLGTNTIGAAGGGSNTLTIYMNFMPSNVMTSDTAYTGEAPQLFGGSYAQSSYAQYDNGAKVFPIYIDGDTSISNFIADGSNTGFSVSKVTDIPFGSENINALEFAQSGSNACSCIPAETFSNGVPATGGYILETVFQSDGGGNRLGAGGLSSTTSDASGYGAIDMGTQFFSQYFDAGFGSLGSAGFYDGCDRGGTTTTNWRYGTLMYVTGATSFSAYIAPQFYSSVGGWGATGFTFNPGSACNGGSAPPDNLASASNLYVTFTNNGGSSHMYLNYARLRAYPPNDFMPTAFPSSVQ